MRVSGLGLSTQHRPVTNPPSALFTGRNVLGLCDSQGVPRGCYAACLKSAYTECWEAGKGGGAGAGRGGGGSTVPWVFLSCNSQPGENFQGDTNKDWEWADTVPTAPVIK